MVCLFNDRAWCDSRGTKNRFWLTCKIVSATLFDSATNFPFQRNFFLSKSSEHKEICSLVKKIIWRSTWRNHTNRSAIVESHSPLTHKIDNQSPCKYMASLRKRRYWEKKFRFIRSVPKRLGSNAWGFTPLKNEMPIQNRTTKLSNKRYSRGETETIESESYGVCKSVEHGQTREPKWAYTTKKICSVKEIAQVDLQRESRIIMSPLDESGFC